MSIADLTIARKEDDAMPSVKISIQILHLHEFEHLPSVPEVNTQLSHTLSSLIAR